MTRSASVIAVALTIVAALTLSACGQTQNRDAEPGQAPTDVGADFDAPPDCPFQADQLSAVLGVSMQADVGCSFREVDGPAILTVTLASPDAGKLTYDYERQNAEETFPGVEDIGGPGSPDGIELGFIGAKDETEGRAVAIDERASFTVSLLNLGAPEPQYRMMMRVLLAAARGTGEPIAVTPPSPPKASAPDACDLLSQDDAERVAGVPLADPQSGDAACIWPAADPSGGFGQTEVYVGPGAQKQLDIDRMLDHELAEVDDLGDEAWLSNDYVYFRQGELWVSVHVVRLDDPAVYQDDLLEAAHAAAGRL